MCSADLSHKLYKMVEIGNKKIGDCEHKTFTLLNDGFIPSGFVEMECRLSDMECEGEAFFICVSDETDSEKGSYAPLEMDKIELKQFIDYLNECYEAMPLHTRMETCITDDDFGMVVLVKP